MIGGEKVLAVIAARGGSKGVPRKNLRPAGGRPLIAWTIEEGRKSRFIDRLIVSSEDQEIIEVARSWGCEAPFVRPVELAQDDTPGVDPVLHAIDALPGYELVVLLQATSPLRSAADIDGCLERCAEGRANACVSVTAAEESPYWMYTLGAGGRIQPLMDSKLAFTRRQELPQAYLLNGAVYVARCEWLRARRTFVTDETLAFVMPRERSLDIDTELDLETLDIRLREMANALHH